MATFPEFFSPPDIATTNVVWLDVNSNMGLNGKPDLLPNIRALINSLFNLFQCPQGARGPIFEPEYGSILMSLLQEPLDIISSNKIKAGVIQAIQRWEPRVEVDMTRTKVTPEYNRNAFNVFLVFNIIATQEIAQQNFLLNRS